MYAPRAIEVSKPRIAPDRLRSAPISALATHNGNSAALNGRWPQQPVVGWRSLSGDGRRHETGQWWRQSAGNSAIVDAQARDAAPVARPVHRAERHGSKPR